MSGCCEEGHKDVALLQLARESNWPSLALASSLYHALRKLAYIKSAKKKVERIELHKDDQQPSWANMHIVNCDASNLILLSSNSF